LNSRFLSGLKDEPVEASKIFQGDYSTSLPVDKAQLIEDVRQALYASKICSYAQGMNIIKAKSSEKGWGLNLSELARIWKGGCIISVIFLDRIKKAYGRNPDLTNQTLLILSSCRRSWTGKQHGAGLSVWPSTMVLAP
jgi:6-phosphogluconate dehydrogenase